MTHSKMARERPEWNLRFRLYLGLLKLIRPLAFRLFRFSLRQREEKNQLLQAGLVDGVASGASSVSGSLLWVHASSAGELEALIPILEDVLAWNEKLEIRQAGLEPALPVRVRVTVFSGSAVSGLLRLKSRYDRFFQKKLIEFGLSPIEGDWSEEVERFFELSRSTKGGRFFLGYRYELWPEMLASLAKCDVQFLQVAVRKVTSLDRMRRFLLALGQGFPQTSVFLDSAEPGETLHRMADRDLEVGIYGSENPRWLRVQRRLEQSTKRDQNHENRPHSRILDILELESVRLIGQPWGLFAQIWAEDIEACGPWIKRYVESFATDESSKKAIWLVPHSLDSKNIQLLEESLRRFGIRTLKLQSHNQGHFSDAGLAESEKAVLSDKGQVVLVCEMGLLAELYSHFKWAYLGGGYSKAGIHSTIEPALAGLPIVCGPSRVGNFSEVASLQNQGQLRVISKLSEIDSSFDWVTKVCENQAEKTVWIEKNTSRVERGQQLVDRLVRLINADSRH